MPQAFNDFYAVLGVSSNATTTQIKAAFRAKAREHHPDRGGDETKMIELNLIREVLTDPLRRTKYDLARDRWVTQMHGARTAAGAHGEAWNHDDDDDDDGDWTDEGDEEERGRWTNDQVAEVFLNRYTHRWHNHWKPMTQRSPFLGLLGAALEGVAMTWVYDKVCANLVDDDP